ncbi:MAG: hypothetical protein LBQ31_09870 [Bacteroidales bacterium]|nr:hypothetical protein [Bacteroidales bacterium]
MGVPPPLASSWRGRAFTPIFFATRKKRFVKPQPYSHFATPKQLFPQQKRISAQSLTQPNAIPTPHAAATPHQQLQSPRSPTPSPLPTRRQHPTNNSTPHAPQRPTNQPTPHAAATPHQPSPLPNAPPSYSNFF